MVVSWVVRGGGAWGRSRAAAELLLGREVGAGATSAGGGRWGWRWGFCRWRKVGAVAVLLLVEGGGGGADGWEVRGERGDKVKMFVFFSASSGVQEDLVAPI